MDLKEFLKDRKVLSEVLTVADGFRAVMKDKPKKDYIGIYDLGLFFWERGGKQFAYDYKINDGYSDIKFNRWDDVLRHAIEQANDYIFNQNSQAIYARDFLDALACFGEEKIKELIGGLK